MSATPQQGRQLPPRVSGPVFLQLLPSPSFCLSVSPQAPQLSKNIEFLRPRFASNEPFLFRAGPCPPPPPGYQLVDGDWGAGGEAGNLEHLK